MQRESEYRKKEKLYMAAMAISLYKYSNITRIKYSNIPRIKYSNIT